MKQQLLLAGTLALLTLSASAEVKEKATTYADPAPVSPAINPVIPADLNTNVEMSSDLSGGISQKKRSINRSPAYSFLHLIGNLVKGTLGSALRPISSALWSSFDGPYERYNNDVYSNPSGFLYPEQINHPGHPASFENLSPYETNSPHPLLDNDEIEASSDTRQAAAGKSSQAYSGGLMKAFKNRFNEITTHVHHKKHFVDKGIQNAKKNLFSNALLARAYASAAAHKTLDLFSSASRAAKLLGDLVSKGLVTSKSAAKELTRTLADPNKDYLDAGYKGMKGASDYLMSTAAGTVDSIVSGIKYSPTALKGLLDKYPKLLTDSRHAIVKDLPYISADINSHANRVKRLIDPPVRRTMGTLWAEVNDQIHELKDQWTTLENSNSGASKEYKKKFMAVTEDLTRTFDALQSRLGENLELQVPGVEKLKHKFQEILDKIKRKNSLAISGEFSLRGLLYYSMGLFGKLEEIDRAILELATGNPSFATRFRGQNRAPQVSLGSFNNISEAATKEFRAATGQFSSSLLGSCIGQCIAPRDDLIMRSFTAS
ncbi:hypothetical protein NEHOM01_1523 [Nematocida homosporus]|uniref:uncharacterized protein n=1 Tax=Nematocida homosporus TaxID=1912981 RepID=UPI00221FA6E7|nr:uncharacterized protein NEHOM01_1523 [Nematocida homosporus]KAI5186523.1 hypothetical protein NEHOM01_1523 [Nematocida homosporus]